MNIGNHLHRKAEQTDRTHEQHQQDGRNNGNRIRNRCLGKIHAHISPKNGWSITSGVRLDKSVGVRLENGRGERIRTSDPHNPIVVRYQAALRPDW